MDHAPSRRKKVRAWRRPAWLRRRGPPPPSVAIPAPLHESPELLTGPWSRYGLAVALAVLAFAVEAEAARIFRPVRFFLFYPGAFLTTWLAGAGPAILYTALTVIGADVLFVRFEGASPIPGPVRLIQLGLFAAFNLFAACLIRRGREAEAAVKGSERRLRIFGALIENSSDFIGIADPEGRPLYVNPAGRRMVGLAPDQPVEGTRIPEYYPPNVRAFAQDVIVKGMIEQGHWSGETFFRNWRTEEPIPVLDEHFMIREPGTERILGMGTVTRDITERKRLEAEVRRLGERMRFRSALEAAATAMLIVDRGGSITFLNEEAEKLFGWSRAELVGRPLETLVPERFRAEHPRQRDHFFQEKVAKRPMSAARELFALRKDGGEVPVEIGLARVEEGGEPFVVASITDISLRKSAERERERLLAEALGDLEAMTRLQRIGALSAAGGDVAPLLSEIVDAAIGISRADFGNIQVLDPASGDLRIAASRGLPGWWLEFWDTVTKGKGACGTALERGQRVIVEDVEASPIFAGTEALAMQERAGIRAVQATPLFSRSGRPVGMLSTHYKTPSAPSERALRLLDLLARQAADLIEQSQTQESLRQSVVELESFAYTISHDLRAPLRAIEGYSHFLAERLAQAADAESREMLARIGKAAARLDRLIRDLLSYSAVAREEPVLEPVDLDEIVAHVSSLYPEVSKATLRVRPPLGRARAQPSLMTQILSNLLVNAVKFRAPGREPEIVIWTERAAPGFLRIVVQDNGIGVPKESWERIFRPFERGHVRERYEGTGIGLAIAKRACERMGGRIGLESKPGEGSRFWVELQEA